jgi:hypothetical protein
MEQATSPVEQNTISQGGSADPNNIGQIASVEDGSNNGGDLKELISLVGHGSSGQGSSKETVNGVAQANSLAANKMKSAS